nr:2-amino-4-hydroxy-6-hydroxymethyldihydropteridine diphosphokinase [Fundidesulfovibrio terrae]
MGSNLGEPAATLHRAAGRMHGILPGVRLAARSRVWHTAPLGMAAMEYPRPECQREVVTGPAAAATSPWYANMAVRLDCPPDVTPEALFEALMALEAELGRNRVMETRWGPRVIDIDLLAFGAETRATPRLTLPHPRMFERAFVLLPLEEVAPETATPERIDCLSFTASGTMIFQL